MVSNADHCISFVSYYVDVNWQYEMVAKEQWFYSQLMHLLAQQICTNASNEFVVDTGFM